MFNIKTIKINKYIHVVLKLFTPSRVSLHCYYVHHARVGHRVSVTSRTLSVFIPREVIMYCKDIYEVVVLTAITRSK